MSVNYYGLDSNGYPRHDAYLPFYGVIFFTIYFTIVYTLPRHIIDPYDMLDVILCSYIGTAVCIAVHSNMHVILDPRFDFSFSQLVVNVVTAPFFAITAPVAMLFGMIVLPVYIILQIRNKVQAQNKAQVQIQKDIEVPEGTFFDKKFKDLKDEYLATKYHSKDLSKAFSNMNTAKMAYDKERARKRDKANANDLEISMNVLIECLEKETNATT